MIDIDSNLELMEYSFMIAPEEIVLITKSMNCDYLIKVSASYLFCICFYNVVAKLGCSVIA